MLDTMQQRCRPIQLEDRPIIDEIRAKTGHTLSAHAFTSLYLWQNALKLSVCLEGDAFFIRFLLRGENAWFYPCGSEEAQIRFLQMGLECQDFSLHYVRQEDMDFIQKQFPDRFRFEEAWGDSEYICDRMAQIEMQGGAYRNLRAKVLYFSSQRKLEEGIFLEDGGIVLCLNGQKETICHVDELQILGTHNHENVMAAAAMAYVYGVPAETIRKSVLSFGGVEHRIEYVAEKNGVAYYNDSKGTNPDAAIKGIRAMKRPTVLIGGGYDKDSEYTEWIESFDGKVKKLILLGQTREKIARDAEKCGFTDYVFADSFEEAVHRAVKEAVSGDAVLLSPACASWDMFPSSEVRGDKFKEIVNSL